MTATKDCVELERECIKKASSIYTTKRQFKTAIRPPYQILTEKNLHSLRSEEGQIKRKIIGIGKGRAKAAKNPDWKEPNEVVYSVDARLPEDTAYMWVRKIYRHAEMVGPYCYPFALFSAAGRGIRLTSVHRAQLGGTGRRRRGITVGLANRLKAVKTQCHEIVVPIATDGGTGLQPRLLARKVLDERESGWAKDGPRSALPIFITSMEGVLIMRTKLQYNSQIASTTYFIHVRGAECNPSLDQMLKELLRPLCLPALSPFLVSQGTSVSIVPTCPSEITIGAVVSVKTGPLLGVFSFSTPFNWAARTSIGLLLSVSQGLWKWALLIVISEDEALQVLAGSYSGGNTHNGLVMLEYEEEITQQILFRRTDGCTNHYIVYVFEGASVTGRRGNLLSAVDVATLRLIGYGEPVSLVSLMPAYAFSRDAPDGLLPLSHQWSSIALQKLGYSVDGEHSRGNIPARAYLYRVEKKILAMAPVVASIQPSEKLSVDDKRLDTCKSLRCPIIHLYVWNGREEGTGEAEIRIRKMLFIDVYVKYGCVNPGLFFNSSICNDNRITNLRDTWFLKAADNPHQYPLSGGE
ncbi:hypothetical protein EDD85DRAFT_937833 [Armillaria nabsnona]|nr:hypothetical protein EDD85DRAFT_937833 [Armillaria nabsnona]